MKCLIKEGYKHSTMNYIDGLLFQLIYFIEYLDGLLEATLSPTRFPKPLKTLTLLLGLFVPFLISSGMFIRLAATIIGTAVRFER